MNDMLTLEEKREIEEYVLKTIVLDRQLINCPRCDKPYNKKYHRQYGPAILEITIGKHRVICLNCWLKGAYGNSPEQARDLWNAGELRKADHFKKLRVERGYSCRDLQKFGISRYNIYEAGEGLPNLATRKKIAKLFDIPLDEV
jgi:DNA-binding XRE family transcriptional regulator